MATKYNEKTKTINTTDVNEVFTLILPYGGNKGDNVISRMKINVSNGIAPTPTGNKNKKLRVIYQSKKLSSKFTIKDKTKLKHTVNDRVSPHPRISPPLE